jgi:hypothetical protein
MVSPRHRQGEVRCLASYRETAFTAALTVAMPLWAQAPITTEELNRQGLNRPAYVQQLERIAPPNDFIDDPVGVNAAALAVGERPAAPGLPGLLPLLGLGVVAAGSVVNTVLLGVPTQY